MTRAGLDGVCVGRGGGGEVGGGYQEGIVNFLLLHHCFGIIDCPPCGVEDGITSSR